MSEASITLGINLTIGKVIVNPEDIRGVVGWHNPYLLMPIKIQLYSRAKGEQVALIRLTASLYLTETLDVANQFGAKISYDFINNLPIRSSTWIAPSEGGTQLLFSLTHEQIKQLEELRHKQNSNLYLYLEPVVVHVKHTDGDIYYYIWEELYPGTSKVPEPAIDMPADIKKDYKEAGAVLPYSPRASAALLRLGIQKLCKHLGQPAGKSIYEDIADLVKAGLSPKVQQALDSVRVIGNHAVHPGEIDLNDNPDVALTLFKLVNFIVEEMITRPREIKEIYDFLPQKQRDAIRGRDGNSLRHIHAQQSSMDEPKIILRRTESEGDLGSNPEPEI